MFNIPALSGPSRDFPAVDRTGDIFAVIGGEDNLSFWLRETPNSGLDLRSVSPVPMPVPDEDGLKLSSDGSTLLLREANGNLHIAALGRDSAMSILPFMRPFPKPVQAADAALGQDGSSVFVALPDGNLEIVRLDWSVFAGDPPIGPDDQPAGPAIGSRDPEVVGTIVLPGHGAMIDRLSVSPDGALVASASIDGRLRITDIAMAERIAGLPLATLPTGPAPAAMQPEPLFDTPWLLLDESLILKVQRGLLSYGIADIQPDGLLGARTIAGIRDFQAANGLAVTGRIDLDLYRAMKEMGLFAPAAAKAAAAGPSRLPPA